MTIPSYTGSHSLSTHLSALHFTPPFTVVECETDSPPVLLFIFLTAVTPVQLRAPSKMQSKPVPPLFQSFSGSLSKAENSLIVGLLLFLVPPSASSLSPDLAYKKLLPPEMPCPHFAYLANSYFPFNALLKATSSVKPSLIVHKHGPFFSCVFL